MIKTGCLVLFRLAQSCVFYVKLESSGCRSISAFRPGLIDRSLGSIDRKSSRMRFSAKFQLNPSVSLNKTNTCFDHGLPTLHIRVLNTLVPKSLEPNKFPIWQFVTKHN